MVAGTRIASRYSDGLLHERPGFDSRQWKVIFLYSSVSRSTLGPIQPTGTGGCFPGGKATGT
jgi:hypothetical protein